MGMSSSSVGFPSLWATGLGRSGIGPEAGGGEGGGQEGGGEGGGKGGRRGGSYGGGLASPRCVGRSHVRDAGESVLCPARRSGAPSWKVR